jgi:putative ABC transport system permease protein
VIERRAPGRIATAIYVLILRAFPRDQRAAYAAEMADAFRRELASRRAQGRWGTLRFVVAAWIDGVRAGLGERRYRRQQRRYSGYGETMNLGMSWLDVKLGFRMLRRFPGLTVAGGLALTIAIGLGTAWHDLSRDLFRPPLPLPGGDRIVEVEMRDSAANQDERRLLHDFVNWRRDVRTLEELGAYRNLERNLTLGDARPEPVTVAQISASAFRIASVPPILGRPLLDSDERPGATPVVVIGYPVWQARFGGRADVVGQTVQLGTTKTTIVGVMPQGFAFPINHKLWTPLQLSAAGYAPLEGAGVRVFGRVAPNATQAQANA